MHPWPKILLLIICYSGIASCKVVNDTQDVGYIFYSQDSKIPIVPPCDDYVLPELKNLRDERGLCLFILRLDSLPDDPAFAEFPIESKTFFARFWKYHGERCIYYAGIPQTSFYGNIEDPEIPSDIIFVCIAPTVGATKNSVNSLMSYMIIKYITQIEYRGADYITDSERCIDGNNDLRLMSQGSRLCILAIFDEHIVVGQPTFNSFYLHDDPKRSRDNSFLQIQANYRGCAPQWGDTNFTSNYTDNFIPDGHCTGALGLEAFELLCCCYAKREECAFTPRPIPISNETTSRPGPIEDPNEPKVDKYVVCVVGRFNKTTNYKRRYGPVDTFLKRNSTHCSITMEFKMREDLGTYDITYIMDTATKDDCDTSRGPNKPFLLEGFLIRRDYTLRSSVYVRVCCVYTMCNNIGVNFYDKQDFDIPKTFTPQIGREIEFKCGYPPTDVLRYVSKNKVTKCVFAISVDKDEGLELGVVPQFAVDWMKPFIQAIDKSGENYGYCMYILHGAEKVPQHLSFMCSFNRTLALTYTKSDKWLDHNYNLIQKTIRQVKHENEPLPECRSTLTNLVPLIDFIRGNFTERKTVSLACYAYLIFDDFGGTMVSAGPCAFDVQCCAPGNSSDKYHIIDEPCKNGFCAQSNYRAVCFNSKTDLPDLSEMIKRIQFSNKTTDVVVSQSLTVDDESDKITVPYYCMFGVVSLCQSTPHHAIEDARTCLTTPIDTFDSRNRNGIRKTTISHPKPKGKDVAHPKPNNDIDDENPNPMHTYFLTCALDREEPSTENANINLEKKKRKLKLKKH